MKVKNPSTGNFEEVYVKALDSLPVGSEIDFTGSASDIPVGWEQVREKGVIDTLLNETTTADTYTIPDIENYDFIVVVGGTGNLQRWLKGSMIVPVDFIKSFYYDTSYNTYVLNLSSTQYITFAFPSKTSFEVLFGGDRTGLVRLYGVRL